jgi:nicotinamidase-related amidase
MSKDFEGVIRCDLHFIVARVGFSGRQEPEVTHFPQLDEALRAVDAYYRERGIFQDRFGFGKKPAVVVVDYAYGWTDEAYAGGSRRLDGPVESTARLLDFIRTRDRPVPIVYTTSPWHPDCGDQPFKSAADRSPKFRPWDQRACQIDHRVAPTSRDLVIEKENASAFFGTHLVGYLIQHGVDTLLITGCSTSACIRATATDAKSYRFKPIIIRECVGDRAEAAHEFTLFDIQARFADVESLERVLEYLEKL